MKKNILQSIEHKIKENSFFNKVLSTKNIENFKPITSNILNTIKLDHIKINHRDIENNLIKFELDFKNNIFVNSELLNFTNKEYIISIEHNNIYIVNPQTQFRINYNTESKRYSIVSNGITIPFEKLVDSEIKDEILYYPILVSVIESFFYIDSNNMVINIDSNITTQSVADYEGTGLGFHKDRKSADYFCNRDHNKILKQHTGWCSPGVSISCLWDNHACVCSAEYYSGNDCN